MKSVDEYVDLMSKLKLANPKMMDVAVPANMRQGLAQDEIARKGWAVTPAQALALVGKPDVALIDLRERSEREKHGVIPSSLHAPYPDLQENIRPGGMLHELATATAKRIVFYCAFGERSAMAVQAAQDAGCQRLPHPRRPSTPGARPTGRWRGRRAWGSDPSARRIVLSRSVRAMGLTPPHLPTDLRAVASASASTAGSPMWLASSSTRRALSATLSASVRSACASMMAA